MTIAAVLGGPRAVTQELPHFRWPLVDEATTGAVMSVLERNELSYPRSEGVVAAFESVFAREIGLPYAISTHSGTGAIHAAWFALDLPPGSEVIVPAYTHIGTVLPALHCGLIPVLSDVDLRTGNIDPRRMQEAITPNTTALAVTHQFGLSCRMPEIRDIARAHGLRILEDCSHAHGARSEGKPLGVHGDVACFSLQAHKAVPAGEGGILLTSDPRIAERASLLGHFREPRSWTSRELERYASTGYGMKSRLHPLAAALALAGLERLPAVCESRRRNYAVLEESFPTIPGVSLLPNSVEGHRGGFFRFVVKIDRAQFAGLSNDSITRALHAEGAIEVKSGSLARPLHSYPIFQDAEFRLFRSPWRSGGDPLAARPVYRTGDFPGAEEFSATTLQISPFTEPSEALIRQYADALGKVQRQAREIRQAFGDGDG